MFIQRPNAKLHTLSFGHGPITLLAVGGWTAGGEIWHPLFGELPRWRCISVDHRGAGASVHSAALTVDAMADDLLAVADAHQVGPCVLAAESAGAAAALLAAQRAPHRFLGVVLIGAAWQRTTSADSDAMVAGLRTNFTATLQGFIHHCLPETPSPELRRWGLQMLSRSSPDDAVALLRAREHIAPLAQIATPVLALHGERDHIVPVQSSKDLARHVRRLELHVLAGLGHVPIVTAPADVARLIHEFGTRLSVINGAKTT